MSAGATKMMHSPATTLVLLLTLSATVGLSSSSSSFGFNHQQQHLQQQLQPQQELVPSTNIFTPPWLAQRRSRHLTSAGNASPNIYALYQPPQMYQQPQQLYQQQPRTSLSYLGNRGSLPMFHLVQQPQQHHQQQYIQPTMEAIPPQSFHSPRFSPPSTAYYPPSTSFYLAPVVHVPHATGDHHFAKRVDHQFLKSDSIKPKAPCPASALPSEHYPVYVLPPKNFQPIVYHPQQVHSPLPTMAYHPAHSPSKSAEELWYENNDNAGKVKYGNGNKLGTSDGNALETGRPSSNEYRKIYLVPVTSDQVGGSSFPVYEAVIREVAAPMDADRKSMVPVSNAFNSQIESRPPHPQSSELDSFNKVQSDQRRLKTKLPVGLTSFFLGGIRGVSGRHWAMPPDLVKDLEFMPNSSPMSPENKYLPEESYVKKVDNGGGDASVASAGDPEKEDQPVMTTVNNKNQADGNKNRKIFEGANTIIDSPLDLETAESSPAKQVISSKMPPPVVSSTSMSIPKS